jgi:hypothetical protein
MDRSLGKMFNRLERLGLAAVAVQSQGRMPETLRSGFEIVFIFA